MKVGRQRTAVIGIGVMLVVCGCQAQSSVEAAQTAVVAGQTALVAGQAALATVQPYTVVLQGALAGANLDVKTTPDGALPQDITAVTITATDAQGSLTQVDARTRQAAVSAAMVAASQYFPKASIQLTVLDAEGATLVSASMAPGQTPAVQ